MVKFASPETLEIRENRGRQPVCFWEQPHVRNRAKERIAAAIAATNGGWPLRRERRVMTTD